MNCGAVQRTVLYFHFSVIVELKSMLHTTGVLHVQLTGVEESRRALMPYSSYTTAVLQYLGSLTSSFFQKRRLSSAYSSIPPSNTYLKTEKSWHVHVGFWPHLHRLLPFRKTDGVVSRLAFGLNMDRAYLSQNYRVIIR
jgi:hypothetical protein